MWSQIANQDKTRNFQTWLEHFVGKLILIWRVLCQNRQAKYALCHQKINNCRKGWKLSIVFLHCYLKETFGPVYFNFTSQTAHGAGKFNDTWNLHSMNDQKFAHDADGDLTAWVISDRFITHSVLFFFIKNLQRATFTDLFLFSGARIISATNYWI